MGVTLSQKGKLSPSLIKHSKPILHPIAYYLNTFGDAECNYNIYERELLAVMQSLEHWRHYLGAIEKTLLHPNRLHQPSILEIPKKPKS